MRPNKKLMITFTELADELGLTSACEIAKVKCDDHDYDKGIAIIYIIDHDNRPLRELEQPMNYCLHEIKEKI